MKFASVSAAALLVASLAAPAFAEQVSLSLDEMDRMALPASRAAREAVVRDLSSSTDAAGTRVAAPEVERLWFVELKGQPTVSGGSSAAVNTEQGQFRKAARAAGVTLRERDTYRELFNGFSVAATRTEIRKVRDMREVKAIYPVVEMKLDASDQELYTALGQTGANIAQSSLGLTGHKVRVAVMDTGVDYDHPDLGGCFGMGCRVIRGYDFVGDAFDANPANVTYNPVPTPDLDPDDCGGHGTHVAGIIGANGAVRGVAPEADLMAYRVFGCAGSTDSSIMIKAMERARRDGAKVLNMSIGASFQWPQYPTAVAADRLAAAGVTVVASIGNSGTSGLYAVGAPGVGKGVIGVASIENTNVLLPGFDITRTGTTRYGYISTSSPVIWPSSGSAPIVRATDADGDPTGTDPNNEGCSAHPASSLTGKIALIRRGTCSFQIKVDNAAAAGAAGVVLYNNAPTNVGWFSPLLAGTTAVAVTTVSDSDGTAIANEIAAGATTLTFLDPTVADNYRSYVNSAANLTSSFSSYGPPADLSFKPDVAAPGGQILSTYPLELGAYANISGTSMASPHTAGAAALIHQARPGVKPEVVRMLLQNTADPTLWSGNPGLGFRDLVHRIGAGMIDIDDAILNRWNAMPSRLALGEFDPLGSTKIVPVKLQNLGERETFDMSFVESIGTYNTRTPGFYIGCVSVSFDQASITVPRGATATVNATITDLGCGSNIVFGGHIQFTARLKPGQAGYPGAGKVVRIPLTGFSGDYQAITPLTAAGLGLPALAYINDAGSIFLTGARTFTFAPNAGGYRDVPMVVLHAEHQIQELTLFVKRDIPTGIRRKAFTYKYYPRNSTSTGYYIEEWNGMTPIGPAPDGVYNVELCALKAKGDPANPAHTQCVALPQITVDRP